MVAAASPPEPPCASSPQPADVPPPGWFEGRGKVVCGPMVRVSTLGFRLMAAEAGAQALFSEELIAQKLVKTERRVTPAGVVEYVLVEQYGKLKKRQILKTLVFSTLQKRSRGHLPEGAPVVLQLGANDPDVALAAARHLEQDVDAVDLNMGCPKQFSLKGGMGAALLSTPDRACAILSKLAQNLSIPVTAKIRMLEDRDMMLALMRALAVTGIKAVTVHARFKESRYTVAPMKDYLTEVLDALHPYPIPVFFNGDVWDRKLAEEALVGMPRVAGIMICRGALYNPTCFSRTPLPKPEAFAELIKAHMRHRGGMREVKYTLTRSFQDFKEYKPLFDKFHAGKSLADMWRALGNDPEDDEFQKLLAAYDDPIQLVSGTMEEYAAEREAASEAGVKRSADDGGPDGDDAKRAKVAVV